MSIASVTSFGIGPDSSILHTILEGFDIGSAVVISCIATILGINARDLACVATITSTTLDAGCVATVSGIEAEDLGCVTVIVEGTV